MLNSLSPVEQLTQRMLGDEKAERFTRVMVEKHCKDFPTTQDIKAVVDS